MTWGGNGRTWAFSPSFGTCRHTRNDSSSQTSNISKNKFSVTARAFVSVVRHLLRSHSNFYHIAGYIYDDRFTMTFESYWCDKSHYSRLYSVVDAAQYTFSIRSKVWQISLQVSDENRHIRNKMMDHGLLPVQVIKQSLWGIMQIYE